MTDTLSETDGDEYSPHNYPIRVYEASGDTYAVAVETTFADGSTRAEHYTEEQARAIFEGLDVLLNDPSEVGAAVVCGCGEYAVEFPQGNQPEALDVVCPECGNHFGFDGAADDFVPEAAAGGPPHPHDQSDAAYNRDRSNESDDEGDDRYVVRHESGTLTGPYTEYVRAAQVDSSNDHHGVLKIDEVGGVDDPVPDGEAVEEVID